MVKDHPRSGESHDFANFFPHLRLIAVHLAIGTKGFVLHEGTFVTALPRIVIQRLTRWTETVMCAVNFPAVELDHKGDNLFFLFPLFLYSALHFPDAFP